MWTFLCALLACVLFAHGEGSDLSCEPRKASEMFRAMDLAFTLVNKPSDLDEICKNKTLVEECDRSVFACNNWLVNDATCLAHVREIFKMLDYVCSPEGKA
ncbi:hypothetical protein ElyMa_006273300, partial [Elysia marginata]